MAYVFMIIKIISGFISLLVIIRLMGKKELAEASPLDIVYSVALGDLVGDAAYDPAVKFYDIFIAVGVWSFLIYSTDLVSRKVPFLGRRIKGESELLIHNGQIMKKVMRKNRLSEHEVENLLRQNGAFHLEDVKVGILEANGKLSVLKE